MAVLHARCFSLPRPWTAEEFTSLLTDSTVFSLTSDRSFLLGRTVLDEAELLTLAVAPEARRKGLARRLLATFEAHVAQRGATRAFLEVVDSNAAALALYRSAGWQQAGRRRGYFTAPGVPPQDALILTRSLDARAGNSPMPEN